MDGVSDSTLQVTFKRLVLVEIWCLIREKILKLSEKVYVLSLLPTTYLDEALFYSYISTQTTCLSG